MTLAHLVGMAVNLSMALVVLGLGLRATLADATSLFRHPDVLARSLLSMNVVMPLFAAGTVAILNPTPPVAVAIIALALSPVPPILPRDQIKGGGSRSYVIGLLAATAATAMVVVPLGMAFLSWAFGEPAEVPLATVATVVLTSVLVPLGIGITIRHAAPELAERIAPWVSVGGSALLTAAFLPVLVEIWPAMMEVLANGTIIVLVAFALAGLAMGHYLGSPDPDNRTALALATATRHPGLALAITAATFPDVKSVLAVVLWHLVAGAVVSAPYINWRQQMRANAARGGDVFANPHPHR